MLEGKPLLSSTSIIGSDTASVFTDLNGLNAIKQQGRNNDEDALRSVARQFESMFVNMMLKSMRAANAVFAEGNMLKSHEGDMHQQMYDDQLSLSLTEGRGMGLADILFQQMQQQYLRSDGSSNELQQNLRVAGQEPVVALQQSQAMTGQFTAEPSNDKQTALIASMQRGKPSSMTNAGPSTIADTVFKTPVEFVQKLLPQMQQAAKEIGIDAKALIAQAALETGWGSRMIEGSGGQPSFNLFGIKATGGWQGDAVRVPTLEFENGMAQRKHAAFRAYESFADSAMDYAKLIKNSPRYQAAMETTENVSRYWQELQSAGYATDPQYANKLNTILHSDTLKNAMRLADTLD